jgi:hypothetical protein
MDLKIYRKYIAFWTFILCDFHLRLVSTVLFRTIPEILLSLIGIGQLQQQNYVTRIFRLLDKLIFLFICRAAHLIQG